MAVVKYAAIIAECVKLDAAKVEQSNINKSVRILDSGLFAEVKKAFTDVSASEREKTAKEIRASIAVDAPSHKSLDKCVAVCSGCLKYGISFITEKGKAISRDTLQKAVNAAKDAAFKKANPKAWLAKQALLAEQAALAVVITPALLARIEAFNATVKTKAPEVQSPMLTETEEKEKIAA